VTVAPAPHGALACTDCHANVDLGVHPDAPPPQLASGEVCAQCHDTAATLETSVHAPLDCADCHGPPHEIRPPADLLSTVSPVGQIQACAACHSVPASTVDDYLASVHARALLRSGLLLAPSCDDCHGSHDIRPPADPESPVSRLRVAETCGSCHVLVLEDWHRRSAHGQAFDAGSLEAPVCITCHAGHRVVEPTGGAQRLKSPQTCGGCHELRFSTYADTFHGQATSLGFMTAATCSDCHTPHRNLPAADPASSVHRDNLEETCGACHRTVSAAFTSFDPHPRPQSRERSRPVYWVWLSMTSLLVGVFAFFGLHTVLWLQRSLVGGLRGEFAAEDRGDGPHVRRFSRLDSALHGVVILTFLVLAATGLPLKFHYAAWAGKLAALFGGIGAARVLHRAAAVLTFGYFLIHLAHLVYRGLVRKEPGLLWGWRSLTPRLKDIADLWQNLRYFLHLGPRPRLDRWSYWEKFDYFAVFWGVAIIGVSGLALWLPELFAAFLPGWVLNVAHVVHSDEALLATGFIFIFHFFHTHLRPESFPLDPVIFTGRMPLERFKVERPLEYERLVRTGTLEAHLVPPPTRARRIVAYVFGGTAVTIGLLLAVAIIWSLLTH
jgi:thiosulfate reductase cytochrome b subunit/nitrate/TMAO reductase-like tetraheme cytochrome c subunit